MLVIPLTINFPACVLISFITLPVKMAQAACVLVPPLAGPVQVSHVVMSILGIGMARHHDAEERHQDNQQGPHEPSSTIATAPP